MRHEGKSEFIENECTCRLLSSERNCASIIGEIMKSTGAPVDINFVWVRFLELYLPLVLRETLFDNYRIQGRDHAERYT